MFTGYSIFVVLGDLPECDADTLLKIIPAVQVTKPHLLSGADIDDTAGDQDKELQRAIDESRKLMDAEDTAAIGEAMAKSLGGNEASLSLEAQ